MIKEAKELCNENIFRFDQYGLMVVQLYSMLFGYKK